MIWFWGKGFIVFSYLFSSYSFHFESFWNIFVFHRTLKYAEMKGKKIAMLTHSSWYKY